MRNPKWYRDEVILALDLYYDLKSGEMNSNNPEVIKLSELLNRLPIHTNRPANSISPYLPNIKGKNMGDYWNENIVRTSVANQKLAIEGEHPAPFPEEIITLPILQTSKTSELILDPFMGSGTTGRVCDKLGRSFVGYDLKGYKI